MISPGRGMDVFKKRFPTEYDKMMRSADGPPLDIRVSRQGGKVPAVTKGGKLLYIHSRFEPLQEAERLIREIDVEGYTLFIVLGFGFAYHIEELIKKIPRESLVLAIERRPSVLRSALEQRDLSPLLEDDRLVVLLNPNEEEISEALRGKSSRRAAFIPHRGSFQIEPEYYRSMQGIVGSLLSTKDVNIATLARFDRTWAGNIARNIGIFIRAPGAGIFFDRFRGIPAIVAAAGPSLLHSIDFIKKNRERAVIIAVDTSYGILLKHGVEPHFCLAVDPQAVNARYFEGSPSTGTVLVADPMVHPSVFRLFKGPVAMTGVAFRLLQWIDSFPGGKGDIIHGGSVSTNACDFALRTGASPVILTGQDLAFTGGYAHARGSYLDEQVHLRTNRLFTVEMHNRLQLTALPKISVRGIRGSAVHTNQKMMIFLSWFEKRKDDRIINATHDGARIPGMRHVAADEIPLSDPSLDIAGLIREVYLAASAGMDGTTRRALGDQIREVQAEIASLIPVLRRAVAFSEELNSFMRAANKDRRRLDRLLQKLSEIDRIVESKRRAKDMISFTAQRVVHTINEGYDIDENEKELSEQEKVAKRSHYLYQNLLEGAKFNIRILKKMSLALDRG
jgi:hypothetical protein